MYAPKTSTGTANLFATKAKRQEHQAENPFFRDLAKKIVGAVPVKSEGAVMKITVLIQKKDVVEIHSPPTFELEPFYYVSGDSALI